MRFRGKLCTLTLDNWIINDVLIINFKSDFGEKKLFNGVHIHTWNCALILNIMVQDEIKVLDDSIKPLGISLLMWLAVILGCKFLIELHNSLSCLLRKV